MACSASTRARAATAASSGTRAARTWGSARRRALAAPADGSMKATPMPARPTTNAVAAAATVRVGCARRSPTAASPRAEALRREKVLRHRVLVGGAGVGGVHTDEVGAAGRRGVRVPRAGHELVRARRTRRAVDHVVLAVALTVPDAVEDVARARTGRRGAVRGGPAGGRGALPLDVGGHRGVPPG